MATVQFVDSLPVGLENVKWQIVAPAGGMEDKIDAIKRGEELFLDLAITREERDSRAAGFSDRVEGGLRAHHRHAGVVR